MKRLAIPVVLLAAGLWMLTGCLFVPTWEYRTNQSNTKDFREYVGGSWSWKPIRPFHANRAKVLQLLGSPPLNSHDGRAIGYVYIAGSGAWVSPICAPFVEQGSANIYAVRLVFNRDDVVERVDFARQDMLMDPLYTSLPPTAEGAIADLNRTEPVLDDLAFRNFWQFPAAFRRSLSTSRPAAASQNSGARHVTTPGSEQPSRTPAPTPR